MSQPYIAQEVCVIERTIRQEPMTLNSCSSAGLQGLGTSKLTSDLFAIVSGKQQHVGLPSYPPSVTSQSTGIPSCPQLPGTVKSPGFFELGSCFNFFQKLLFLNFFYVLYVFIIILNNKNKSVSFSLLYIFNLDASLKFGERRHTSFFFKQGFSSLL